MEFKRQYLNRLNEHSDIIQRDMQLIESTVKGRAVLLEIGCGVGSFMSQYRGGTAVGVDVSYDAALFCRANDLTVAVADANTLPFASHSFDVVRAKEILEHIPNPLKLVSEIKRVLCEDGLFICHVPTPFAILYPLGANFFDDYTHVRPFSKRGVEYLLQDGGFRVLKIQGYTSPRDWWQRPIAPLLSRLFPFVWRAMATPVTQE